MSFFEKEKEHVEGFSPELAVVTHGGGEKLEEPLVVRPTSETIIGYMYSKWIKSWRDLPVLINQWGSVLRWELRTKLFLRTAEFYWQEGHTAHASQDEAIQEMHRILDIYADFAINEAAIPVIKGTKTDTEKFAGAVTSTSIEGMMQDKRALQSATSHYFGQNFARAFEIQYLDRDNKLQFCETTSWGLSTRMIGAIIMVHGDDQGLLLPPRIAPTQAVIIPIYKTESEKGRVLEAATELSRELLGEGIRAKLDDREEVTPGFKFNDWELRGVPLRIEIGPKDIANGSVSLARRDLPTKANRAATPREGATNAVKDALVAIQANMLDRATAFRDANIHEPATFDELRSVVQDGWAFSWWCGRKACEARVKEETKATTRNIPFHQQAGKGRCIVCGEDATQKVYFARAY
jgi:prolyl-tRNA synthetase